MQLGQLKNFYVTKGAFVFFYDAEDSSLCKMKVHRLKTIL